MLHLLSILDLFISIVILFSKKTYSNFSFAAAFLTKAVLVYFLYKAGYLNPGNWSSLSILVSIACLIMAYLNQATSLFYRISVLISIVASIAAGILIHSVPDPSYSLFIILSHVLPAFLGIISLIFSLICSVMILIVNYKLKHSQQLEEEPSLVSLVNWTRRFNYITLFTFSMAVGSILVSNSFKLNEFNLATIAVMALLAFQLYAGKTIGVLKKTQLQIITVLIFCAVILLSILASGNRIHG